jgi:hypothetical protein
VATPFRHEYSLNSDNELKPLPNSVDGVNALGVAIGPCLTMVDRFNDENTRGTLFDQTVGEFFPVVNGTPHVDGQVGHGFHADSRCVMFRMDKVEMGQGADLYTQIAHAYDMACERMEINNVAPKGSFFLYAL